MDATNSLGMPKESVTSVPEDLKGVFEKQLRKIIAQLMNDSGFCKELKILDGLKMSAFTKVSTAEVFPALAFYAVTHRRGDIRRTWESLWILNTGKTWKSLRDFPKRIRGVAGEVQKVSSGFFFDPTRWITGPTLEARVVKRRFQLLPGILRVYATWIESMVHDLPVMTARVYPQPKGGRSAFMFLLSMCVKTMTGRFCDKEVANLLNAAALALGEDPECDALTLAQARSRRKKQNRHSTVSAFYGE